MSRIHQSRISQLKQWDQEVVWHAFTQMAEYEPLIFAAGEGCELIDIDGRRYLDGVSSLWCNLHGHRHPHLDQAIRDQLDRVAHVTSLGASNPQAIELAKRLVDLAPADDSQPPEKSLGHVFYSGDGSSAVEVALKLAFQYWRQRDDPRPEKNCFLALDDAYHGDTLGSVSVGGVARFHAMFEPLLFETIRLPAPDCYRLPAGIDRAGACEYYLDLIETALHRDHDRIAAVVIEPLLQAAAGMLAHPPGLLRGLRDLTRRYDVLLIADEVAVGFGRTGTLFACQQEQVVPDLLCLGKGLTGGYLAMAATLATTEIWQAFLGSYHDSRTFYHGHTFGGNPLAAAAALASLEVFERERVLEQLPEKISRLSEHLRRIAEHPHVGDVRQRGLMAGIELVRDRSTREPFGWQQRRGQRVCDRAMADGVWLRPLGNVVVLMPPLCVTLDQIDTICRAAEQGIADACSDEEVV